MSINRIKSIGNAGVFRAYSAAGDDTKLSKHNLIYGFNGSGKTTVSRLLSSLATGELCALLPEGTRFEIELEDGTIISDRANLEHLKGRLAVFNSDYVDSSFQWKEGSARPIFYIGREQAEQGRKLRELGLEVGPARTRQAAAGAALTRSSNAAVRFKRDTARHIGEQVGLRNYNAARLDADFAADAWGDEKLLSDDRRAALRAIIFQTAALAKLDRLTVGAFGAADLPDLIARTRACLRATVGALALEDLAEHQQMMGWVKEGQVYHREHGLEACLFCGNALTQDRLAAIAAAVDDRFDQIVRATDALAAEVAASSSRLENAVEKLPSANDVTQDQRAAFSDATAAYERSRRNVADVLLPIARLVASKAENPNAIVDEADLPASEEVDSAVRALNVTIDAINGVIDAHNIANDEFEATQRAASNALRGHFLAEAREGYSEVVRQVDQDTVIAERESGVVLNLEQQIEQLSRQLRSHGPAAEAINGLIKSYLRHGDIEIVAHDEGFQLRRAGGRVAKNLSEGEKTAVTFCHFLSSLEADGRKLKDVIVVVDDPISSLDTKALNYAFSLIKGHLAGCHQLIILTHNMNFLNSCRNWLKPRSLEGKAALLYLDVRMGADGARTTTITRLPTLIRDYDSEYHYLFSLVRAFANSDGSGDERLFLMPNAMRKVAEIFLAFKRPGADGLASKIEAIASAENGIDPARIRAIDRLVQLESHADSLEDLVSFSAMTVEESHECAVALMDIIKDLDPNHFQMQSRQCDRAAQAA